MPNFWLRALKALDCSVDCIHRRDEALLARLADVRFHWDFERPMPSVEDPTRHGPCARGGREGGREGGRGRRCFL